MHAPGQLGAEMKKVGERRGSRIRRTKRYAGRERAADQKYPARDDMVDCAHFLPGCICHSTRFSSFGLSM
jgi:hypothetical protein